MTTIQPRTSAKDPHGAHFRDPTVRPVGESNAVSAVAGGGAAAAHLQRGSLPLVRRLVVQAEPSSRLVDEPSRERWEAAPRRCWIFVLRVGVVHEPHYTDWDVYPRL